VCNLILAHMCSMHSDLSLNLGVTTYMFAVHRGKTHGKHTYMFAVRLVLAHDNGNKKKSNSNGRRSW
jgi:hypothetical protein